MTSHCVRASSRLFKTMTIGIRVECLYYLYRPPLSVIGVSITVTVCCIPTELLNYYYFQISHVKSNNKAEQICCTPFSLPIVC